MGLTTKSVAADADERQSAQLSLLPVEREVQPRPLRAPGVRRSDDVTSKLAIEQLTSSGRRESANNKILAFLRQAEQPLTYREISRGIGHSETADVMKRLNDLRVAGFVEKCGRRCCSVNGNKATVWRVK